MNLAWHISRDNFTEDDGSLPGIKFRELTSDSVHRIVEYFFREGTINSSDATIHDLATSKDIPISAAGSPAGTVCSGAANHFHCCFSGLTFKGVSLPIFGLFVFSDALAIDYRMGSDWTPGKVDAFFGLLAHLITLAPEAIVDSEITEGLPFPKQFNNALDHYAPQRKHE